MKTQKWYTQDVLLHTRLFGKEYFWMRDVDGTIYLAKSKETDDGLVPDLT